MRPIAYLRFAFAILLFALISHPAIAQTQTPTPPVRDPQAVALLQRCSEAMGTLSSSVAIEAKGQITSSSHPGESGQITIEQQGLSLMRRTTSYGDGQQVEIVNEGENRIMWNVSVLPTAPWQERYFRPDHISALACTIDLGRPQMSISYVGLEPLNQTQVHHIRFFASGSSSGSAIGSLESTISQFDVYLDSQSFNVVRTTRLLFAPDAVENHSDWDTFYTDYRPVNGVLMPFHIQHFLVGQQAEDIVFTSVQTASAFPSQDFQW